MNRVKIFNIDSHLNRIRVTRCATLGMAGEATDGAVARFSCRRCCSLFAQDEKSV